MPHLKFTKRAVEALPAPDPSGKQTIYWDTEQPGFGILVSGVSNAKSYVVLPPNGRRKVIAPARATELDDARSRAKQVLYNGADANRPKQQRVSGGATLREVFADYLRT